MHQRLANSLADPGRHEPALYCAAEAVATLSPYFLAHPQAFARWMATMVGIYHDCCPALDREPDPALLGPILAALEAASAAAGGG